MLFDLRSRGRRRTVQVVYLGLALLMFLGLVLFGVGAGNGFGGLLNAFTGNGSGGAQSQVVSQQEKTALKATKANPNDPSAWASLVQARWTSASQGSYYNATTGTFTTGGKKELSGATDAWQQYLKLTSSPNPDVAVLAARAYEHLADFAGAAAAWEIIARANQTAATNFECLAANAYAAKQTRKGDLATAKALSLLPKAQQTQVKQALAQAKTNSAVAQSC